MCWMLESMIGIADAGCSYTFVVSVVELTLVASFVVARVM